MNYNKILVSTPKGYVAKYEKCNTIQIGFGTTLLGLNRCEFESFLQYIQKLFDENQAQQLHEKSIWVNLGSSHVMMVVTVNELIDFLELLRAASVNNMINESLQNLN